MNIVGLFLYNTIHVCQIIYNIRDIMHDVQCQNVCDKCLHASLFIRIVFVIKIHIGPHDLCLEKFIYPLRYFNFSCSYIVNSFKWAIRLWRFQICYLYVVSCVCDCFKCLLRSFF